MRIVLIVAQSLDGFITRHSEPGAEWTSPADKKWFRESLGQFDAQVMASKTYATVRERILQENCPAPFRMIMTRQPDQFADDQIPGKLEFSSAEPASIRDRLINAGCHACALLGGATAHDAFLATELVDEMWVTIEPRIFGTGTPVVAKRQDRELVLIDSQRLPKSDSVVLKYRIRS